MARNNIVAGINSLEGIVVLGIYTSARTILLEYTTSNTSNVISASLQTEMSRDKIQLSC